LEGKSNINSAGQVGGRQRFLYIEVKNLNWISIFAFSILECALHLNFSIFLQFSSVRVNAIKVEKFQLFWLFREGQQLSLSFWWGKDWWIKVTFHSKSIPYRARKIKKSKCEKNQSISLILVCTTQTSFY